MAALSPVFQTESGRIHADHLEMLNELSTLDLALEHIGTGHADMTDAHCIVKARAITLALTRQLPEHCMREENSVFKTIAEVSSELAAFVEEMKHEHVDLFSRLHAFCIAQDELPNSGDLPAAMANLKEMGMEVSRALRHHIAAEEHELQGFL
jgi:iron-sulfur cluster repair protein YtfE (RIC family)